MSQFRLLTRTRQSTEYSCGASALQIVLGYWGKKVDESELMRLLRTNPEVGTHPENIVQGARALGFEAEMKDRLSLDEVARFTESGNPVIALAQVWRSHKDSPASVADDWSNGHYIVVLGVDKDYVYFQDPYVRMSKAFAPRKGFEEHWHHAMGGDRKNCPDLHHLAIFIRGDKPADRPTSGSSSSKPDFKKLGSLNLMIAQFRTFLLPYDFVTELSNIWASGDVRPDAFIFLRKDKDGSLWGLEGSRLEEEEDMQAINALISALAGRRTSSAATTRWRGERAISAVAEGDFGVSARDIRKIAKKLPPSQSLIAVLFENVWERKFKDVATKFNGSVIDQKLMIPTALALQAGAIFGRPARRRAPSMDF